MIDTMPNRCCLGLSMADCATTLSRHCDGLEGSAPDTITLPRAEVEALMEAARAFQMIRAVWTDPHNDNLMRKASMTLDALRERMK